MHYLYNLYIIIEKQTYIHILCKRSLITLIYVNILDIFTPVYKFYSQLIRPNSFYQPPQNNLQDQMLYFIRVEFRIFGQTKIIVTVSIWILIHFYGLREI